MSQSGDVAVRGFRVAVNAVIEREGRVLLARRRATAAGGIFQAVALSRVSPGRRFTA